MSNKLYFTGLLKKNLWIYFFSFLIAPTGYIVKIIMTGTLSKEDYGIFVAVISFVIFLGAYNDFWMAESLNFFLPEHLKIKNKKKITQTLSIALVTQILSSTLLAIILFFTSNLLAIFYFKAASAGPLINIFILFFFADNVFRSISTFFQATQDVKLQKLIDFIRNFLQLCLIFGIAALWKASIDNYAWAYNGSAIIGVSIAIFLLHKYYASYFTFQGLVFWREDFYKIFKYAIFVMISANIGTLLSQLDKQLIVVMLGTTEAWVYDIYLSMMRIPFMLLLPWVFFLFPVFSDLLKHWETGKVALIHTFCYELFTILGLMAMSFFILFWDNLTSILFWPDYALSGKILLYSSPFLIFNFLLQIDFQSLNAMGRPKTKMYILLAAVVFNLVTNIIFLKLWWIVWSAFASGLGWLFIWIFSFRETKQFAKWFRWRLIFKNFISIGIVSWAFTYLHLVSYFSWRFELLLGLILVMLVYVIVFLVTNFWELLRIKKLLFSQEVLW